MSNIDRRTKERKGRAKERKNNTNSQMRGTSIAVQLTFWQRETTVKRAAEKSPAWTTSGNEDDNDDDDDVLLFSSEAISAHKSTTKLDIQNRPFSFQIFLSPSRIYLTRSFGATTFTLCHWFYSRFQPVRVYRKRERESAVPE